MTGDGAREAGDFWNDLEGTVHRADDGEALLESEQRFKFLWEHSVVAGALTLPTGEVEVNDAFCEMLGYKREELVNKVTWMQLTHPQDVEETQRQVDAILSGEKASVRFEKRYLRKDGGVVWTDLSSSVRRNDAGEPLYLMTTMVDITERKRAESSAKEDQRRIENLLATAPFQIWSFNGETYDFVNREYLSFTGLEIEGPLTPETWTAYVHPDDLEKAGEIWQKAWEAKAEHDNYFRLRRSDGVYRDFWCHAAPILDDAGELERFQGYNIDITDRKHAEEALAASSASHFAILQTAMDGFWLVDTDGRLLEVNEAYCRESGYSEQELLTMNIADLVSPGTIEDVGPRIQRAVAEGGLRFEAQPRRKDGSVFDAEVSVQYQSAGGGSIAAFIHDVTERKRSEEALREFVTSIVDVIGNVSEMRDPYTAGHQRRVAELAAAIERELGMPEADIADVRIAGLMHDVGKMSVPVEILSKPSALTPAEFSLIKGHSQAGYEIIASANMPGPIAELVYQHHERCDGSGYPRGLLGDELLEGAKVLAVADVAEAMMSHRPYRPGLGMEAALAEIERGAGNCYDSQVAEACVRVFRERGFEFSEV